MAHGSDDFAGRGGFTSFDHGSACTYDFITGGPCRELFVYNADSGRLDCASCPPPGVDPEGDALLRVLSGQGGSGTSFHLSHALSNDGRLLFFTTSDPLVPEDTNGKMDAYEFNTETGARRLLSSGTSKADSYFLDASNSGDDVFVLTSQRLAGWDTDENYDLYDARVGGGFDDPLPALAPCQGDSCRAPSSAAPPAPAAASSTFAGKGNAACRARHPKNPRSKGKRHHRCKGKPTKKGGKKAAKKRAGSNRGVGK